MVGGPLAFGCRTGAPAAAAFPEGPHRPWTAAARAPRGWRLLPGFALGEGCLAHAPAAGDAAAAPLRRPPVLAACARRYADRGCATRSAGIPGARAWRRADAPLGPRCSCAWSPYEPGRSGDSSPGCGDFGCMAAQTCAGDAATALPDSAGDAREASAAPSRTSLAGSAHVAARTARSAMMAAARRPGAPSKASSLQPCCAGPSARAVDPIIGCGSRSPRRSRNAGRVAARCRTRHAPRRPAIGVRRIRVGASAGRGRHGEAISGLETLTDP